MRNDFETLAIRYQRACEKNGTYKSIHDGLGVIREEYKELEEEVFKKAPDWDRVYDEALDLATTALRMRDFALVMRDKKPTDGFQNHGIREG